MAIALKRNLRDGRRDKLLEEIKSVKLQMQNATTRFEQTSDADLIEAVIYEIQALKAKYRYLVKSVKLLEEN